MSLSKSFFQQQAETAALETAQIHAIQERASMQTFTSFGKFARYLFAVGIDNLAKDLDSPAVSRTKVLKQKAHSMLDARYLRGVGFTGDYLRRDIPTSDVAQVYLKEMRKVFRNSIEDDPTIPSEEKLLWRKAVTLISKSAALSPSGKNSMGRIAWSIADSVGGLFDTILHGDAGESEIPISSNSLQGYYAQWRTAAKALIGKSSLDVIPPDTLREAKGTRLDKYVSMYREARRLIKSTQDVALRNLTRSGPQDPDELGKKLKDLGFAVLPFVTSKEGFKGKVGLVGNRITMYTTEGSALSGGIAVGSKIRMNPNYNPETEEGYYLEYVAPNAAGGTRVQTAKRADTNQVNKHKAIKSSTGDVKKWTNAWTRDMKSQDPNVFMSGTAAMILYLTAARVGSSTTNRSKKGAVQTYGIISLLVKHVKIRGNTISFRYTGKKGVKQHDTIEVKDAASRVIKRNLETLLKDKQPTDFLFSVPKITSRGESETRLNYSKFVSYTKSTGIQKIHSLRNIRGTQLLSDLLGTKPFKPKAVRLALKQKEGEKYMIEQITEAGKLLGHKSGDKIAWKTTVTSYIHPDLVVGFFKSNQLEVPKWVPTHAAAD